MITGINESNELTKHTYIWKCQWKFDGGKCNSNQKWNNGKCQCECKKYYIRLYFKKVIIGIQLHVVVRLVNI